MAMMMAGVHYGQFRGRCLYMYVMKNDNWKQEKLFLKCVKILLNGWARNG
jgi:hypothetical protein